MIGTTAMKELTILNNKFTESEVKKENKFSRSRNLIAHVYNIQYLWVSQLVGKATLAN